MQDSTKSHTGRRVFEKGSEGQEWTQEEIDKMVHNNSNIVESNDEYSIEWEFGERLQVDGPDPIEVMNIYLAITDDADL